MVGDLALEGGLRQPFRQRRQQAALAAQLHTPGTSSAGQTIDQLLIDRVQTVVIRGHPRRPDTITGASVLGHLVSHRYYFP
jgi:hypothetical protein